MTSIAESPHPHLRAHLPPSPFPSRDPQLALSPAPRSRPLAVAGAAAGPVAIGGVLAARLGDPSPLLTVPAVVFAVAAMTLPALYIATAVVGAAPPVSRVIRAVGRGLSAVGLVYLGLALPLLFLGVSSTEETAMVLAAAAVATGALIGLRALHTALFEGELPVTGRGMLFLTWAAIVLVIGARLFVELTLEMVP
jgi:hypothetical protein